MTIRRTRHEFWGTGPAHREIGGFSLHRLDANAPEHEVEKHSHDEAHFVLVLAGGYMSSAAGAPVISNTPLLIFNPPGTTHRDRFHEGRGSFLAVSGGYETGEGRATAVPDAYAIWTAHRIALALALDLPTLDVDGRAHQLLAAVQPLSSDEARDACRPPSWLQRVFEMAFTADDATIGVADLAAEAGVHPVHLARVFRRYLHCSPGEYLRGRRLERATALLGRSTASLADIAYQTGFADQSHFTHAFRARHHRTPGAWRQRHDVARIQDH